MSPFEPRFARLKRRKIVGVHVKSSRCGEKACIKEERGAGNASDPFSVLAEVA
jgi:hypothetical protein